MTGVDLTDFQLARDGALVDFTSAQLESLSNQDYVLTLPDLFEDGQYSWQLLAEGSGIADQSDPVILLDGDDALVAWTRDTLAPSLSFAWTEPSLEPAPLLRIAALGDSQTTEVGNSYVPFLRQSLSTDEYSVSVFAEAGWQVHQVRGLWDSSVKDADFDVAVFFAGVNDLISSERSAEEIFGGLSAMFDEALARNMSVVAVGVSPWSNFEASTIAKQTRTLQLNELISQIRVAEL